MQTTNQDNRLTPTFPQGRWTSKPQNPMTRKTQDGLMQYRNQIVADGKPMSDTVFSDWAENDGAFREQCVENMAEQGFAVFSVVIGEITRVHVDKRIILRRDEDDHNVWHWKIQEGQGANDRGGMSGNPTDAINDARSVLGEVIHCWRQSTEDMQVTLFDASSLPVEVSDRRPVLCLTQGVDDWELGIVEQNAIDLADVRQFATEQEAKDAAPEYLKAWIAAGGAQ